MTEEDKIKWGLFWLGCAIGNLDNLKEEVIGIADAKTFKVVEFQLHCVEAALKGIAGND